jgi:hypothetical protein
VSRNPASLDSRDNLKSIIPEPKKRTYIRIHENSLNSVYQLKPDFMGHFTIQLPENKLGEVRFGTIKKNKIIPSLFQKNKLKPDSKTGYFVRVNNNNNPEEYWLFKSKDGKWSTDINGEKEIDSYIYMYISYFISEKESALQNTHLL